MNLQKLTPGAILSLKDQIANFKPLQVLTGNFDIHFGNFMVDKAGRVWSIDAGIAELGTIESSIDRAVAAAEFWSQRGMNFTPQGDHVLDYARFWRDMYRNHPTPKVREVIRSLDELMTGQEMSRAAGDAKRLSAEEFNKMVDEVMPQDHDFIDNVKETFKKRQDHLGDLLNERWPGASGEPVRTGELPRISPPRLPSSAGLPAPAARPRDVSFNRSVRRSRQPLRVSRIDLVALRAAA
jgi:hypothetical protein